jgi:1-Cys peroxiredoxin 6
MLFSHPRDFTPVCTTELSEIAKLQGEFDNRGMKLMALSCDSVESHNEWVKDLESYGKVKVRFPIIADENRTLAKQLRMLDPDEKDPANLPVTVRACFVFGPDGKVKLTLTYPPSVGRSAQELLRVVDALQLGSSHPVASKFPSSSYLNCCSLKT